MTLRQIIHYTIHWWHTLHYMEVLEQQNQEYEHIIEQQADKIQSLELEHEYLQETDKLFHAYENQKKQLRALNASMRNKKARIQLLEESNAFLTNEVDKLNRQITQLNSLNHGKEN